MISSSLHSSDYSSENGNGTQPVRGGMSTSYPHHQTSVVSNQSTSTQHQPHPMSPPSAYYAHPPSQVASTPIPLQQVRYHPHQTPPPIKPHALPTIHEARTADAVTPPSTSSNMSLANPPEEVELITNGSRYGYSLGHFEFIKTLGMTWSCVLDELS